jgi:hypothetical protein
MYVLGDKDENTLQIGCTIYMRKKNKDADRNADADEDDWKKYEFG